MSADTSALNTKGHVVIVGAGQAGFTVASKLRELKYSAAITLIGNEQCPPYQRPPLSKGYLLGELDEPRLYFRPPEYYREKSIELRLSTAVKSIHRADRHIELADGSSLRYDHLVLATGARPRCLTDEMGGNLAGIYYVRNITHIHAIKPHFCAGKCVLIVGGGYIGLEAAAVAAKLGLKVNLIESAPRILQRVACVQTSEYFRALHRAHAVDVRENAGLKKLCGENGQVDCAQLSDGSLLPVDFVIVGIGILPNAEIAANGGLAVDNGICIDECCRTSDAHIYAAGDCASFLWQGRRMRLESVGNAVAQGEVIAQQLTGAAVKHQSKPWFWSDQFDVKLQIAGLAQGYDRVVVRKEATGALSHWYYQAEQLLAVDALNAPRVYMLAKRLLDEEKSPPAERVKDPAVDLRELLQ